MADDSDLDHPRHWTKDVADAARVPINTLMTWLKRRDIALLPPEGSHPGVGRSRMFSYRQAMRVAVTAELARRGVAPLDASRLACRFTDESDGAGGWTSTLPGMGPVRPPCGLFPHDTTVMRVAVATEPTADVVPLERVMADPFEGAGDAWSVVLIDMNRLVNGVRAALGLYPIAL